MSPSPFKKGLSKFSKSFKIKLIFLINSSSSFFNAPFITSFHFPNFLITLYYGKIKQNFKDDVSYNMDKLLNNIIAKDTENKFEENLFVKNIIVNKNKGKVPTLPYIATEKWLAQLGNRLETTF